MKLFLAVAAREQKGPRRPQIAFSRFLLLEATGRWRIIWNELLSILSSPIRGGEFHLNCCDSHPAKNILSQMTNYCKPRGRPPRLAFSLDAAIFRSERDKPPIRPAFAKNSRTFGGRTTTTAGLGARGVLTSGNPIGVSGFAGFSARRSALRSPYVCSQRSRSFSYCSLTSFQCSRFPQVAYEKFKHHLHTSEVSGFAGRFGSGHPHW